MKKTTRYWITTSEKYEEAYWYFPRLKLWAKNDGTYKSPFGSVHIVKTKKQMLRHLRRHRHIPGLYAQRMVMTKSGRMITDDFTLKQ